MCASAPGSGRLCIKRVTIGASAQAASSRRPSMIGARPLTRIATASRRANSVGSQRGTAAGHGDGDGNGKGDGCEDASEDGNEDGNEDGCEDGAGDCAAAPP